MATVALSSKAVGSTVKLKVNGTAKNFIVVHQGKPGSMYDASCDGTWLLMQDCYESRQWHSSNNNDYENSTIDNYLNTTFLNLFESNIRDAIKQVKIPYRKGAGYGKTVTSGSSGLSTKIFLLSSTEVNLVHGYEPTNEGACLSYFSGTAQSGADNKRVAKLNGSATLWWLRSPYCYSYFGSSSALFVNNNGNWGHYNCSYSYGIRPALVLPSNLYVSDDGHIITIIPGLYDVLGNLLLTLPGVQIETGSYTGTGTFGKSNSNSLTFGFEPKIVFIKTTSLVNGSYNSTYFGLFFPFFYTSSFTEYAYDVDGVTNQNFAKKSGNTISWYSDNGMQDQLNSTKAQYHYLVIG